MLSRADIVEVLAKNKVVEGIVANICKASKNILSDNLQDLCQMVYEVLLTYREDMIIDLYRNCQLTYFIVRIVKNQYESTTSPYYREIKRFADITTELTDE